MRIPRSREGTDAPRLTERRTRRMKAAVVFLCLAAALLTSSPARGEEAQPVPARDRTLRFYKGLPVEPVYSRSSVAFPHSRYVFEPALQGDVVRHDFVIGNHSPEILEIDEVRGFPGCIIESYTRKISPGLTGKISTLMLTDSRGGEKIAGTIRARTNDEDRPEIAIEASLLVKEFASLSPYRIWLEGSAGQDLTATSIVIPNEDYPFSITGIKTRKGVWFTTSYREIEREGRRGYEITVRNTRKTVGSYQDVLFVQTDHSARPEFKIRIEGRIRE
jgi:hypothetical protein